MENGECKGVIALCLEDGSLHRFQVRLGCETRLLKGNPALTTFSGNNGEYHCTVDLLFDWFGISCMTSDNFYFYFQKRLIQNSQTGGQWYSYISSFSNPWCIIHVVSGRVEILAWFFTQPLVLGVQLMLNFAITGQEQWCSWLSTRLVIIADWYLTITISFVQINAMAYYRASILDSNEKIMRRDLFPE